jgi:D-glycero-D-manno-heptose 1,7-bisphosphate phosphatase
VGERPLSGGRAVFLDRDGVLNANVFYADTNAWESPRSEADFALNAGVAAALARLKSAGYRLVVISNQPNAAKRKATMATLAAIHAKLEADLAAEGVALDAVHYCYHHPEGAEPSLSGPCVCRKPSPHFVHLARDALGLDLSQSWFVGDRDSDIACGAAAGVKTIFIAANGAKAPQAGAPQPDHRADDLPGAARIVLGG